MPVNPRRVVTGHTPEGKSVFVSDGPSPRAMRYDALPDFAILGVWATDCGMTAVPGSDDPTPAMTTFVPGEGGTRFTITVFPPANVMPTAAFDADELDRKMHAELPGLAEAMEKDNPGMHTTDTVDYDIIISGELVLELDDGERRHLKAGDIVIQNGTRHAWRNVANEPCVMYSVLVGCPRV
ncbi:MAG: cupin domain-containing protein [Dehalococcoidia bacterium]|nr:cupin domain-containing protein [Dehalococcoidia bacterium]